MHIFDRIVKIFVFLCFFSGKTVYAIILLNSSYDVSRELFSEINSHFIKYWEDKYPGNILIIRQSHAGSTRQAMCVLQGLRADVVTYNQITDVQVLHDRGKLIPANWRERFPNNSSPFYSTMAFLVRKGNPKKIYDWNDLVRSGLKIVFPNPKTSGNGRYTYLAVWNFFFRQNEGDIWKTRILMQKFLKNVIVFDTGGRSATSTFIDRKQGDILINFESEAKLIKNQFICENYEIIVPQMNLLVEFPVTWIDKNVERNKTEKLAKEYLNYLYTPEGQKIVAKFGYRTRELDSTYIICHDGLEITLHRVEDLYGDWNTIMKMHFSKGGELDKLLSGCR